MASIKEAEYLADTIAHKVSQLMTERDNLRRELVGRTSANIERDKEYIRMYQAGVVESSAAQQKAMRLERILQVR